MRRMDIGSGANAILIAHLRQLGGSAIVNCAELSKQNNLATPHIFTSASCLAKKGLLIMQSNGRRKSPLITLNEEAIQRAENGGGVPATAKTVKTSDSTMIVFKTIFAGVQCIFASVTSHKFVNEGARQLIDPLLNITAMFIGRFEELCHKLENCVADVSKLTEAAEGLNAEDEQIKEVKACDLSEIVKTINYEELPAVPIVDFSKLLFEPASFFKQLATLQAKTRELRNLLVEMQRESARLDLVYTKLSTFVGDLQKVDPAVDFTAEITEWLEKGDRYVGNFCDAGIAVVSSKQ